MQINIFRTNKLEMLGRKDIKFNLEDLGYIEVNTYNRDYIFNELNWGTRKEERPSHIKCSIGTFDSGLVLANPETDECDVCLSLGWKHFYSLKDATKWLKSKSGCMLLIDDEGGN